MRLPPVADGTSYARMLPNLGFDPTPGDVGLCTRMARRFNEMAGTLRDLATQLGSLDFNNWQGQAGNAAKSLILEDLLPALMDASTIASQISGGVSTWSGLLSDFQAETDTLEHRAGGAAADLRAITSQHEAAQGHAKSLLFPDLQEAQSNCDSVTAAANDLHSRFLKAGETAGREASGEESSTFIKATEDFNKVAGGSLTPFQLVAGDAWVSLTKHLGNLLSNTDIKIGKIEDLPRTSRTEALIELAKDFEDEANVTDIGPVKFAKVPIDVQETFAANATLIRGAAIMTSTLGILGDAGTIISPEDKGAMGNVDRGVAVVNGTMIGVDTAGGLELVAGANASLDWVPGVGEGVIVTSGAYLAGDWLYHHWTPAHTSMNAIADQPSNIAHTVKNGILSSLFFGKL